MSQGDGMATEALPREAHQGVLQHLAGSVEHLWGAFEHLVGMQPNGGISLGPVIAAGRQRLASARAALSEVEAAMGESLSAGQMGSGGSETAADEGHVSSGGSVAADHSADTLNAGEVASGGLAEHPGK